MYFPGLFEPIRRAATLAASGGRDARPPLENQSVF